MKILVVEDSIPFRTIFKNELLSQFPSAGVVEAGSGEEALETLAAHHVDLVFMDIGLPGQSGLETTKMIRALWPDGPKIIAMTAYALKGDRERCLDAGMDDYISKPVKLTELRAALESFG